MVIMTEMPDRVDEDVPSKEELVELECTECNGQVFAIRPSYVGVINCPYCGSYIEG
jgi:DNA-directed RNA polymerase subunit RPC12/RpoP